MIATIGAVENKVHGRLELIEATEPKTPPIVLSILSHAMEKLVARSSELLGAEQGSNKPRPASARLGKGLSGFDGVRTPNISIPNYLERIYKYTNCSPSCFVVGYVYIDRLLHRHPQSLVVSLNVHRLLVTCLMVASKMLDDVHYNNAFYAKVGGVSNVELNRLEIELLFLLDFDVTVRSNVFEHYCLHLEKEMMIYNGGRCLKIDTGSFMSKNSIVLDDHATVISVEDHTHEMMD